MAAACARLTQGRSCSAAALARWNSNVTEVADSTMNAMETIARAAPGGRVAAPTFGHTR